MVPVQRCVRRTRRALHPAVPGGIHRTGSYRLALHLLPQLAGQRTHGIIGVATVQQPDLVVVDHRQAPFAVDDAVSAAHCPARQQADVVHAEESLATLEERRQTIEDEVAAELERIRLETSPERIRLEEMEIPARKTDISVDEVVLAWVPQEPLAREKRNAESGIW